MADISKVQLPNEELQYDIKDNSQALSDHRHHDSDIVPIIHKTYESTGYYATANDYDNASWYFMSVKPDNWYKPWRVKFKVYSYCPAYPNHQSCTWSTICGREGSTIFANWNERDASAHSYITIYPLKQAGFNAGYGHAIAISIYNADDRVSSAHYRTFEIDYFDCEDCTVEILDTPVKWANWTGKSTTNYGSIAACDAVTRGLQETGDVNSNTIGEYAGTIVAGPGNIPQYSLLMQTQLEPPTFTALVTTSATATTKVINTCGFIPNGKVLYMSGATIAAGAKAGQSSVWYSVSGIDLRYSFNISTTTFPDGIQGNSVYIKCTFNPEDKKLYLTSSNWWATSLPTTNDGYYYVFVGQLYSRYQATLYSNHPIYYHDGTGIKEYIQIEAENVTYNNTTSGLTATDVQDAIDEIVTGSSDTKVTQTPTTTNSNYEVIFSGSANNTEATEGVRKNNNLTFNPSTGNLTTTQLNGVTVGSSPKFTDTTYTFDTGANNGQIKVTPSGGTAQNVSVKGLGTAAYKAITDTYSSTGTDATSGKAVAAALGTLDGTVSGTAGAGKTLTAFSQTDGKVSATFGNISITKSQVSDFPAVDTTVTSGSSNLVTSGAVATAIENLPEPMVFKGTLGTGGTITTLPTAAATNEGYTYKVITAGTYASQAAKVGDVFVSAKPEDASAYSWILIPAGDEITSDTWRAIKVNGTQLLGSAISTGDVNFKNGSNVTVTGSGNDITIASTDEKVTSSDNHYAPSTVSGQDKSANATGATAAWSIDVVKGVTLNTDGKGHVTGISVTSGKIPANPNTDTKVRQTLKDNTDNTNRPLLLSYSDSATTTANVDNIAYRNNSIYANPSTGTVTATKFVGDISGGTGLTSTQVTNALGYTPPTQDTNTTYTFANGTNGFTVTPSGGTAQTVTVTPSITNNVTGSGTSGSLVKFTGANTVGDASASADSATTGISVADHATGTITGVQTTTTTASKVTLGTAITVPNVTDVGSASTWAFENITVPKAASTATSIPNVTAAGSGSFTATVTNGVLSFSHVHTAPTLGTAISVTGVSGSTTASHVTSGGNGTAPTLGTAISVPNVTDVSSVTVPIKNTSATTVVTGKTHTVTDNGHTHTVSVSTT